MKYTTTVLIRRGDTTSSETVLLDGEIAFAKDEKLFYIGDGQSVMSDLVPFSSLVAGEDGVIYAVRVDKNGVPHVKPVTAFYRGQKFEFKIF